MLRYMYTLEFYKPPLETWAADAAYEQRFALPIGIFALAGKYGVDKLQQIAVDEFPSQWGCNIPFDEARKMVEAHYSTCVQVGCPMSRVIARKLLASARGWIKGEEFEDMLQKYPNLGADVLIVCPRQSNKLW
jgi:hypothetical protein